MAWGAQDEQEYELAREHQAIEKAERYRLHRLTRFVACGFNVEQASLLERAGVACHFAEQLRAAGCDPMTALRILI